jgi:anti-sigma factor RsiW
MTCDDVRARLLDHQRGRLPHPSQGEVRAHLDACAECARAAALEHELSSILEQRLPQHPASLALKRRLAAQWPTPAAERSWWSRWRPALVPALAVASLVLVATPVLYYERAASRVASERAGMVAEAVNDHLRVLTSQHPLDVENSDFHQVKPWFEGRLDFAPPVTFEGDAEFPLRGGAVGYFRDRKAAVFVYARRLHPITLLVTRAEGLAWPAPDVTRTDSVGIYTTVERGFNVIMWRSGELGYALVSDVDGRELRQLAARITPR